MSNIPLKSQKIIWSISGNSCAICKRELTKKIDNNHIILGQTCHMRSPKVNGPRYDINYSGLKLNLPENLILLCRDHHKEIDDCVAKYTTDLLEKIKVEHESLVRSRSFQKQSFPKVVITSRQLEATLITSGVQLINIVSGIHGFSYSFDETENEKIYDLIKNFLGYVQDLDILPELNAADKLDIARKLKLMIKELNKYGYHVFCAVSQDKFTGNGEITPWHIIYLAITKNKNVRFINR